MKKLFTKPLLSQTDYEAERMVRRRGQQSRAKAGRAPLELCTELGDVYNQ